MDRFVDELVYDHWKSLENSMPDLFPRLILDLVYFGIFTMVFDVSWRIVAMNINEFGSDVI